MLELNDPQSAEGVSDWIELYISLFNDRAQRGFVSAAIRSAVGDEPSDNFLAEVWLEMRSRERLYNPSPFVVEDFSIEPTPRTGASTFAYQICLILCIYGSQDRTGTVQKIFERITNEALINLFSADSLVFGYRGGDIGARIVELSERIKEKFIEEPDSHFKDRGLDVVTWIPFTDGRSGQIVLLTQCASGYNWKTKTPIPLRAWEQYIHWAIVPTMAFSVPCIVSQREWHNHSVDKGMLIDRVRIINGLANSFRDTDLENEISAWVQQWRQDNQIDE